jgi:hypothetical protein
VGVAIVFLCWYGKLDSMWTVIGLMGITGAKEIDFNTVLEIVKLKFGGK